jgi:hypothetical protein
MFDVKPHDGFLSQLSSTSCLKYRHNFLFIKHRIRQQVVQYLKSLSFDVLYSTYVLQIKRINKS